jgi:hypothetical protein
MAGHPDDAEPGSWHRYFAIEFNNRAWDLAEKPSRTRDETLEMLNAAHAAAAHWNVVGSESHRMRAKTLLARAHLLAGLERTAFELAEEVRSYFSSHEAEAWEIAIISAIHAHAAACVGEADAHRDSYEQARLAVAAVADPEELEIVLRTFRQVPSP